MYNSLLFLFSNQMKNILGPALALSLMNPGCVPDNREPGELRGKINEWTERWMGEEMALDDSCVSPKDRSKIREIRSEVQQTCRAMNPENCTRVRKSGDVSGLTGVAEVNTMLEGYGCLKADPWLCSQENGFQVAYCTPNDLSTDVICPTTCKALPEEPLMIIDTYTMRR